MTAKDPKYRQSTRHTVSSTSRRLVGALLALLGLALVAIVVVAILVALGIVSL
jgi:uncharacterized metal-binding protein